MRTDEKYSEQVVNIQKELALLKSKLNNHYNEFIRQPNNWSFVGDLNNVLEKVKDLNQFLNIK